MPPVDYTTKHTASLDGTEVSYQVAGSQGPWIVVANGLGAGNSAWRQTVEYFADQARFMLWDYRGLVSPEENESTATLPARVDTHAQDLHAILQTENVQGGTWLGWSFGAQVLLEAFRHPGPHPDRLILINPCYGRRPRDPAGIRRLLPFGLDAMAWSPEWWERAVRRASSWPETASWLKRLGFVAPAADQEGLLDILRHFRSVNAHAFLRLLRAAATHRIDGILGGIDVPTLVIFGDKDWVTPRFNAEPLARQISNVELFLVRNGTHFVPLEYPELINLRVEKFLREHASL